MGLRFSTYRTNDIETNLSRMKIRPLDVMVTGVTGAGKSTTLNAFFERTVAKVGTGVDPETMDLSAYALNDFFRLWDTPGLGDGMQQDKVHSKKLVDLLWKTYSYDNVTYGFIDIVLVIIEGINRDMGTTYKLLNEVIFPNIQSSRVLVAVNQADVAMKGRFWNKINHYPEHELFLFLEEQIDSIQRRVREASGINIVKPIYYSAEYNYNVDKLFDLIINNMPNQKRNLQR